MWTELLDWIHKKCLLMRKIMDWFIVILFACNSRSYNIVTTITSVSGKKVFDMFTSNVSKLSTDQRQYT